MTAWLEAPAADGDRLDVPVAVFLGGLASPEALIRTSARSGEAEALRADLEERDACADGSPTDFHAALTRRYGLAYARALIEWADEVERELGA